MERINPDLVPRRKLSNGMVIPGIGMGTFGNDRYTSEEVGNAVYGAIRAGYRLFDCAAAYGNEKEIGAVQRGQIPISFSIFENEYVSNLKCTTEDFLTDEEMEIIRKADQNARLIKGKVFLWEEAKDWRDIWDGEDEWNIM